MKAPLLSPSRRTLNNYAIFYAKPSRKTLNKFGKPSTTLIIPYIFAKVIPFSKDHKCILWLDYEITRQELEECHTLCHGNWIEIEHKYKYIQELRHLLDEHGIPYPEEYEID